MFQVEYVVSIDGKREQGNRDLLRDGDGTYGVVITKEGNVVFIISVRPGLKKPFQIEFPAGGLKMQENALKNVIHEIQQKTGIA